RDRVARQYATNFDDLWDNVLPVLRRSIEHTGDWLSGIARAHLRILAAEPDTLIARKNGWDVAAEVCRRARTTDPEDAGSVAELDHYLRSDGNRLNPGTTADLIAAAIYLLLRLPLEERADG
ncbi:MAG: triphosphoribosyl-dephospho-CoA synthase, partial [Pirellulales bacterium]|nr:triphosphoribosyl-dephospho-CoA synthase [Pirellulales bacterium]